MILTLHGTGSGDPGGDRFASALSLLFDDQSILLFDAGEACSRGMRRDGVDLNAIRTVAISHMHPDHWCGLPALWVAWMLARRSRPVDIHVPSGTIEFFRGVQLQSHAFPEKLPYEIRYHDLGTFDLPEGWIVDPVPTTHMEPARKLAARHGASQVAMSYILRNGSRRVVLSQDLGSIEDIRPSIASAELLVCEATHVDPRDLLSMARDAGVRRVLFTHIPPYGGAFPERFDGIHWSVASDGERIRLD